MKEKSPQTLEPPPKMEEIKNRKWNPQYRSGILKVSSKGQGVWNTPCKTKFTYLLHFTINTTPLPACKPLPKHTAAVAMASSVKSNNFVEWNKR